MSFSLFCSYCDCGLSFPIGMGIAVEQWRASIGQFAFVFQSFGISKWTLRRDGHTSLRLCVLLTSLLLLAGVEPNPGPIKLDDIAARLDAVMAEVKESRDQATKNYNDLAVRLTATIADLTAKIDSNAAALKAFDTRLKLVEQSCDQLTASTINFPPLPSAAASPSNAPNTGPASTAGVDSLLREMSERDRRKCNVVIYGLASDAAGDETKAGDILNTVLKANVTIKKCVRTGKDDNARPRPLLVTLASETEAHTALKCAPQLRKADDDYIKTSVFLHADLTKAQREAEYLLREERRHRLAAGERDLVIRNGRVVTKGSVRHS